MIGRTIGQYKVVDKIGEGGMGTVYKAEDTTLGRLVALKSMSRSLVEDEEARERFIREAQSASSLNHPGITTVYELVEDEDTQLICMEYVEGKTIRDMVESGHVSIRKAVDIILQTAEALEAAHAKGILHRDIKSSNIMVSMEGRVKVMDFGLAHIEERSQLTRTGTTMGTLAYSSPEQLTGRDIDKRSEIWSLGVVFYELLTGQLPFKSPSEGELVFAIINNEQDKPSQMRDDVPESVCSVINRMLLKQPELRYQSLGEVISDLKDIRKEMDTTRAGVMEKQEEIISVAVLPFANLSPNPDDEYLSDGISEEIRNSLAGVPDLRVIARTSAFALKGMNLDVREIGAKLGANRVVDGSVQRSGTKLRVTAQLIRAADGHLIWSKRYDRESEDIFAIEDEIAASIAEELNPDVPQPASVRQSGGTSNTEAYDLYFRGRHHSAKMTDESMRKAASYYEQAYSLDPLFAQAYAAFASAQVVLCTGFCILPSKTAMSNAREAASRAVAIAPDLADGHTMLAVVASYFDWDREVAREQFDIALSLDPNSAAAFRWHGFYLAWLEGEYAEAIEAYERAVKLNPLDLGLKCVLGYAHYVAGDLERALAEFEGVLKVDESFGVAHYGVGDVYAVLGRTDDAIARIERSLELTGRSAFSLGLLGHQYGIAGRVNETRQLIAELEDRVAQEGWCHQPIAAAYMGLGDQEKVFEWLDQGVREKDPLMIHLTGPLFNSYRSDPRFQNILHRMGLGHFNK